MKYRFSNCEESKEANGKLQTYKVCDNCGRLCQCNCGYEVRYCYRGSWRWRRVGLCQKCANLIVPELEKSLREIELKTAAYGGDVK